MKFKKISLLLSCVLSFILIFALTVSLTAICVARAINEKTIQTVTSSVLQNDEVREEVSKEISVAAMSAITDFIKQNTQNPEEADSKIQSWEAAISGYIDEFLATPEVQEMIGNIASDYAMAVLSDKDPQTISVSSRFNDLISENGDMVNEKFEKIFTEQNLSEEAAHEKLIAFAAEKNITVSENADSYSAIILEIVKAPEAQIDKSAQDIFGNIIPASSTENAASTGMAYKTTDLPYPMLAIQFSFLGLDVNFHEDQTPLEIFSQVLNILQNPIMYIFLIALVAIFFILFIFSSISFKKSFLFTGISILITGILLILISKCSIPFDLILNRIPLENAAVSSAVAEAIPGIWASVSSFLFTHAIFAIVIGILFLVEFFLIKTKKKKA